MSLLEIIQDFKSNNKFILNYHNNTLTLQDDKNNIYIFNINNLTLNLTNLNQEDNISQHLINIINLKKFNNINLILDLLEYLKTIINTTTNYCISCINILDHQSNIFTTCGNDTCIYKYEELNFNNPVVEKYNKDPEIFEFLLQCAIDAILSDRRLDIFEPFPSKFLLENDLKIVRTSISKLININYDAYKDFNKLNLIINNLNLSKLLTDINSYTLDREIIKNYDKDTYSLLRFIIMSSNIIEIIKDNSLLEEENISIYTFNKDLKVKTKELKELKEEKIKTKAKANIQVYKIIHPLDKEQEFEKLKQTTKETYFLFHGSRWQNWYSIMRNGLKNCSQSKLMTAGAAYGNGIYLSNNINTSYGYGVSYNTKSTKSQSIVGVFEILGNSEQYKKASSIYVIENDKILIQRYLLIINDSSDISRLDNIFITNTVLKQNKDIQVSSSKSIKRLHKEYKQISSNNTLGITISLDLENQENMYLWSAFITKYDEKYLLGQDMKKYNISQIELEISFPESYPFSPPFVRVVHPRFQHLSGHVTSDGALCMEILTPKGWAPACSLESLLVTIRSEILEGDGRLDQVNYNKKYDSKMAQDSFIRVAKGHGWL
jgi:ubiquitin-protein ligase